MTTLPLPTRDEFIAAAVVGMELASPGFWARQPAMTQDEKIAFVDCWCDSDELRSLAYQCFKAE